MNHAPRTSATRIVALGSTPLMDGFRLAGIEVIGDATAAQLEALLESLVAAKQKALVLIESGLADEPGPWLRRVRSEGGRIVVVQVPSLARPGHFRSDVDRLLAQAKED
jgi:vacuolar-type H+-ATPase subunit F/Vma7